MGRLRTPWNSQPPAGTQIDWSNPLCRGLAFVSVGDVPVSLTTNNQGTLVGTVSKIVSQKGRAVQTVSGAGNRIDYAIGCRPSPTGEVSFGSVFRVDSDTGALQYLINRDSFANLFTVRTAGLTIQQTWNGVGIINSAKAVVAGAWNVASSSSPPVGSTLSTDAKLCLNGVFDAGSPSANGALGGATTTTVLLNGRSSDNLRNLNGAQALSVSWNRVLSHAEHAAFNANPWQIFQPLSRNLFDSAIGGGGGPVTHTATGVLANTGAAVAGASNRFRAFASTGALTTAGAAIVGAANRFRAHDSTGALTTAGAAIVGTANRFRAFASTGALTTAGADIVGAANRFRAHDSTGALTTAGATVAGAANRFRTHDSTGTLATAGAAVSGTSVHSGAGGAVWPDPANILAGVQYGPTGTEYTGTLSVVIDLDSGRLVKVLSPKTGISL